MLHAGTHTEDLDSAIFNLQAYHIALSQKLNVTTVIEFDREMPSALSHELHYLTKWKFHRNDYIGGTA